ncbi:beta-ketoacyl synthase N-terminal-like domain-containing protein [Kutzneria buriramensis]|uniref:3-oxoacyl-[acyl-carrier-protein] synthase II n=1 Tax=Kutzneria buriramensis TaxID=1045776 RepID=A0A3E0H0R1_9PSEU|nr:beta-ketoacyl synthase N-terminal-like domain-containing protein [Kutzneria buriramensis]REH36389.1 3-oxoacyl-[acyl-carrier-protein] synthase II [Kutzneria buriramensis]
MTKVFVTGLGAITPIGVGTEQLWSALCSRRTHFSNIDAVYSAMKPGYAAGLLSEVDRSRVVRDVRDATGRSLADSSTYAAHAALQAVREAGLTPGDEDLRDALVCVANNEAEADLLDELVEGRDDRWRGAVYSSHAIADNVARAIGSTGPAFTVHNTCASANVALEFALRMMRTGAVRTAVVGGGDAFSKKVWTGFYTLNTLGPEHCRPFSVRRKHITIAEGAAFLVLRAADAPLPGSCAELVAAVSNNDAVHPTNPDPGGVLACHERALAQAGLTADQVDGIFAHGTGTQANDAVEAGIFTTRFPDASVTAIKGTIGHLMASAGAVGAVASCLALRHQKMPPTIIERDEYQFGFDLVLEAGGRERRLTHVQNNAFGFGGNNGISVFRAVS